MTQRFSLYQDLSVRENLEFVARLYGIADPVAAARAMIERLGLDGREEQLAGELSGGWKQRLALGACTLPNPQLLLLDEPTAGVDPKARREFWNEIHALAAEGLTVLVSTHYMDEAERCHEIAYIAYGVLLAHGTVDEVIAALASDDLHGERGDGEGLTKLAEELAQRARRRHGGAVRHQPACVRPRRGGARGRDRALSRPAGPDLDALASLARGRLHRPDEPRRRTISNEPPSARDAHRVGGFWRRTWAMLIKEFIQLKRDRVSFAHDRHDAADAAPAVRLRHQHQAAPSADRRAAAGAERPRPLDPAGAGEHPLFQGHAHGRADEAEFDRLLASGTVLFAIEIPAGFERAVRRGDRPALLVAADATDPVAAGSALGALGQLVQTALRHDRAVPDSAAPPFEIRTHARYNPAGRHLAQHRAGPGRHHPHHDHADLHRAVGDARDRARHHGKPARRCRSRRSRSCSARSCPISSSASCRRR